MRQNRKPGQRGTYADRVNDVGKGYNAVPTPKRPFWQDNRPEFLDVRSVARALGGDVVGGQAVVPGPRHSRRDRSLSIRCDEHAPGGFVVYSFAGDDPIACRDYVRAALGLPAFAPHHGGDRRKPQSKPVQNSQRVQANDNDLAERIEDAMRIWSECGPAAGTVVETYLASRGLTLGCPDIRYHPSLKFDGTPCFGMVALMRDIVTSEPCGVHRTYLDAKGGKLTRKMLGLAKGACVKLSPDDEVSTGLGIAEGIETAMAVMRAGFRPVWACLSARTIETFPVLPGVECLTIFADNDASGTGERVARACADRWRAAGREVQIVMPARLGDWADTGMAA